MTTTKAVRVSLLPDAVRREAFAEASRFRGEFYECLTAPRDELFELADAVLCADGAVKSPVDLTLLPEHRRGHGAMYGGLNHGRIDVGRLRAALAELSLPRFDGGRLVLAVDVSPWLRSDAPCSAERLFCHVYGRAKTASQFILKFPQGRVVRARKESTRCCGLCREGHAVCGGVDEESGHGVEVCCWGPGGVCVLVHQSPDLAGGVADGVLADGEEVGQHGRRQGEVLLQHGGQDPVGQVEFGFTAAARGPASLAAVASGGGVLFLQRLPVGGQGLDQLGQRGM